MKHHIINIGNTGFLPFYLFIFLLFPVSCADFDDATETTYVNVQVVQPADFTSAVDLSGKTVTMTIGQQSVTTTTDATGLATFSNIVPDVYTISTSWTMTGSEYQAAMGTQEAIRSATVSGSINSQLIRDASTLQLQTNISVDRDIVVGKVYYAGTKDNNNRNYSSGQYIELFNQSNDTVDVSGLYIGLLESENTPAYTLQNLQDAYADSVVLLKQAFRIPRDSSFLVAPGGTVLLVNSAINHTETASSDNDLRGADFEAKDSRVRSSYTNNPDVPALELVFTSFSAITYLNLPTGGPVGVVLFRTGEDVSQWSRTYAYGKTRGTEYLLCPVRYITDGFEALKYRTSGIEVSNKRLYSNIDAGYTYINATNGRNGEVVYRKTMSNTGHIILSDTNNSTNDFEVSSTIKPRQYDE